LSQQELAALLDVHQGRVSRYEDGSEYPPLLTALALQVIFNRQPSLAFASIYAMAEERVMLRAAALEKTLRGNTDPASKRKLHLLENIVARATNVNA
jgi:transcriptional regulator with XRE-family HTH domain